MATPEPLARDRNAPSFDEAAVAEVHARLMAGYAAALGEAEQIGRLGSSAAANDLFAMLVRRLLGGDIRKKLRALAARYAQLEAAVSNEEPDARERLARAREDCELVAAALPSLRVTSIFALLPLATGIVALVGFAIKVPGLESELLGLLLLVLGLAFVSHRELRKAYRRKREIFLPGASEVDHQPAERQKEHDGPNLYRTEDELFALLGTGKPRETQVDFQANLWAGPLLMASAIAVVSVLANRAPSTTLNIVALTILGLGTLAFLGILLFTFSGPRIWR